LYDGHCALCNWWVRFLLWADRDGPLRFGALTSQTGQLILQRHPDLPTANTLILATGDSISLRSTAVLDLLRYLGGGWRVLSVIGRLIPREIRDSMYDVVAHWRYRLFGRYQSCPLPPSDARARFVS